MPDLDTSVDELTEADFCRYLETLAEINTRLGYGLAMHERRYIAAIAIAVSAIRQIHRVADEVTS
jgi:hypothetical protein